MNPSIPSKVNKLLVEKVSGTLNRLGIMYRIFSRVKDIKSLDKKIESNEKYILGISKVQDLIGVRVVLYFPDDIELVHKIMSTNYSEREKDASIDNLGSETFKPIRYNLVYELPDSIHYAMEYKHSDFVDNTFELQIRTVLSEGWHEVEHDLRYKFKDDWTDSGIESRKLNGVYASIETNEWTMIQILEGVAYKHYKQKNWEAMLRQKLRLRIQDFVLSEEIILLFDNTPDLAKKFFRIDRELLVSKLYSQEFAYPLNLKNLVYFTNVFFVQNADILALTPPEFIEEFSLQSLP